MEEYQKKLEEKEKEWEALCLRCGACCGAFDDPCQNLRWAGGKSYCAVYERRFGTQKAVSGESFNCVHITKLLDKPWKGDEKCAYKQRRCKGMI
jgi:uncharacterized cysteine cluster protein YcgN (CxxCxxCC family)